MRFIGNKEKLLEWIYKEMQAHQVEGHTFFDFFAGTSNVGRFFKTKNHKIISSDLLYFSYVLQKAYIENNEYPKFKNLISTLTIQQNNLFSSDFELILEYLNNLPLKEGFIYKNYTPEGSKDLEQPRMYFTGENGQKIDAIRLKIEAWKQEKLINENEYFILLASLIETVPFFSNILGVYAAFKKGWDVRALKKFKLRPLKLIESQLNHQVFNKNSVDLLEDFDCDVIYLDPPYNQRQYAPNYHILETIAKYDNPKIKGVSGMRNYENQKSDFCNKEKALKALDKIIKAKKYKYLLLSYNSEGIMPQGEILKLMKPYGTIEIVEYDYLRFKSNNNGKSKTKKYIKEQLYILTKNKSIS